MKKLLAVLLLLGAFAISAQAEIRSIDITIFGMD
jgi:hypothetical protein